MKAAKLFLKQNVQMEPLFNQWYAWPHLISPATAAMNIANSHVKIMRSYLAAPQVHANAVKNPAMLGGPFIDYNGGRTDGIEDLLNHTLKKQAHMIEFADAVRVLDQLLRGQATGYSLEPLYQQVPERLKGYVELVYDLNDHPSIKFIEGLLYQSKYYDPSSQSLSLSIVAGDNRAFALSTPRLPDPSCLHLSLPFNSSIIDDLFGMRTTPKPVGRCAELLRLNAEEEKLFSAFLTEDCPPPRPRYQRDGVRLRYYGHACVSVETKDVFILIDPVLSYAYEDRVQRFSYRDLPDTIDYVLITHGHQDHLMLESLLQIRHKVKTVIVPKSNGGYLADPSLKRIFLHLGFKDVREIEEMDVIEVAGGSITGLPFLGEHADLGVGSKIAHLIEIQNKRFLFAADSNNLEPRLYKHLFELFGGVDVLFLGMECEGAPLSWLYGPLMTKPIDRRSDQSRRLAGSDYEKGLHIVEQLDCKEVYVYAMGQEPWLTYVMSLKYTEQSKPILACNKLIETCLARGIFAESLFGQKEIVYRV